MCLCLDIFTTAWASIRFLRFRGDRFQGLPVLIPITTSAPSYRLEQDATASRFANYWDHQEHSQLRSAPYEFFARHRSEYNTYSRDTMDQWKLHLRCYTAAARRTFAVYFQIYFNEQLRLHDYLTHTSTTAELTRYNDRIRQILRDTINSHDHQAYYMPITGLCLEWYPNPCSNTPHASMFAAYGRLRHRLDRQQEEEEARIAADNL